MLIRESLHCTNPDCPAEAASQIDGAAEIADPRCACGAPLKKRYVSPVFRYLDFLRLDEPGLSDPVAHKNSQD